MTTGLQISNGTDFDSLFQTGSGTQLLYTYGSDGQDIGQRYLPASSGSAYGSTGFYNPSGTDVGNLLCKAGTNYHVTLTIGSQTVKSYYSTGSGENVTYHYYNYNMYGFGCYVYYLGSMSKKPCWGSTSNYIQLFYIENDSGTGTGSYSTRFQLVSRNVSTAASITVTNITANVSATLTASSTKRVYSVSGDPLKFREYSGKTIKLAFSPVPIGYA